MRVQFRRDAREDCAKNAPERRVTASEPVPRLVPWSDGAGCFCSERRFESRVANASVSVARRDERVVGVGNASSSKTSPGTSERCRRAIARVVRGGERFRFRRRRFDRESAASTRVDRTPPFKRRDQSRERASGNRPVYPLVLASSGDRESVVVARAPRVPHILARAGRQPRERSRTDRPSSISSTPRPRWRRRERSTSRSASPRRAGAGASAASRPGAKARSRPRPRWRPRPGPAARTPSRYAPPSFPHHSIARVDRPSAVATDEARTRAVVPETAARPPFKTATLARARHRGSGALELRLARLPVRASARPHATPPFHPPPF